MSTIGFSLFDEQPCLLFGFDDPIGSTIAMANTSFTPSPPKKQKTEKELKKNLTKKPGDEKPDEKKRKLWLQFNKNHGPPPGYNPPNKKQKY